MKITLNWLKQYVDFTGTTAELAERLTMLGLEVEGIEEVGGGFEGVVVAQVITRDKHPNADKLSVCRVNDGQGERQIVCGAQNFQPGDKVPLILPGSALPPKPGDKEPFVIKVGKIRGVESHGMMCAAEELNLDPAALGLKKEDGLLILPPETRVGLPFAEFLGRGERDVVYDLEVTPNRPDLNSLLGIAREISAVTGNPLRLPSLDLPAPPTAPTSPSSPASPCAELVAVRLEAADLCPRYTARVLLGVRVGPSPSWLRGTLEKVGLRSINNVVDVTNFVMLETGQPLHAFDYHLLGRGEGSCPTVVVRRAADGEKLVTLDGKEHTLNAETLLIADERRGIALAGVMGGQNTEIQPSTTDVLLESAYFQPTNIRRTSKALGVRSDSSYRFERGADIGATDFASRRAVQLILQTAGGTLAEGSVDAYPAPVAPRQITLRHARVNELLGVTLKPEEIEFFLAQLGLKAAHRKPRALDDPAPPEPLTVQIPTYRVDLKREADLIEEVTRLYGVDRLPATAPRQAKGTHPFDAKYDEFMEVRRLLAGLGLNEAQGQTLISAASVRNVVPESIVRLANPLSSDMDVLRPSLLPGLLDVLRHNLRHQSQQIALFEIGRVFRSSPGNGQPRESWRVALALTGPRDPAFWSGAEREARFDLYDLKGLLEEFLEHLGLRGHGFARTTEPGTFFSESGTVSLGGGKLLFGELGQLQPRLAKQYDLRDPVFLAELDLDQLLARRNAGRAFKSLPTFPASRRDVAMVVAESVTHDAVVQAIRQAKAANLENVELFDVFRGKGVTEGHKSLAYAFTYRGTERTLTDAEVNAAHEKVVALLKEKLAATLRE